MVEGEGSTYMTGDDNGEGEKMDGMVGGVREGLEGKSTSFIRHKR